MNAGLSSLASQAAVAMVNNGGDIGKTLEQLGSEQSVRNLLSTMVTAGALDKLNSSMTIDGVKLSSIDAQNAGLGANLAKNLINNIANATITSTLTGANLEDSFKTALTSALLSAGAGQAAYQVGDVTANDQAAKALAHALAGCVAGAAGSGSRGCSSGAIGAVVGEPSAQWYDNPPGSKNPADVLNFAKVISAAAGAITGDASAQSVNTAVMTGANAAQNNYLYHYKGKIIARDKNDNDKIINLSDDDLRKLAADNPEILSQMIAGIGKTDAPILVMDSSAQNMTSSGIQDLANPNDRAAIAKESEMGYVNINGQARVFVQTGMRTTPEDAAVNAQALSTALGGVNTGYINNATDGFVGDVGEYLPNSLGKKDVLNEYTYRTLNAQGPKMIATHSAGNEDARKALQAGALYGHNYNNLSFISLGSPVSDSVMRQSITSAGATYLGQVNDWRDPVTYSKLFLTSLGASGAVGAVGAGQSVLAGAAAGPWGWLALGGGAAVTGLLGSATYGVDNYHPFPSYISKPQSQSIMFDWLKNNLLNK